MNWVSKSLHERIVNIHWIEAARIVCWAWTIAHVSTCMWLSLNEQRELRAEARILLDRVCNMPRGYAAGSSLIRCEDARAILASGPLIMVAFERAGARLVTDALSAARREISAALQVVGLLGTVVSVGFVVARNASVRFTNWQRASFEKRATSEFHRSKQENILYMPPPDFKDD